MKWINEITYNEFADTLYKRVIKNTRDITMLDIRRED